MHPGLHLSEEVLLRPNDRARPAQPEPRDHLRRGHAVPLHEVQRYERAGAPEASLAMDREPRPLRLDNLEESFQNGIGRVSAVCEVEVIVVELGVQELFTIVNLVIESNDPRDVVCPEVVEVRLGRVGFYAVHVGDRRLCRSREGEELSGDDPVEVAILHSLIVLILIRIESLVVVPAELDGLREALQAMVHGERVARRAERGVAVRHERRLHVLEFRPCLRHSPTMADDQPRRAQEDRVCSRVCLWLADMIDLFTLQLWVAKL
mmetsp:Transcript_71417/g.141595  ORF Transcript_71417/g.141595 Transcript_71417/m.141595 type:complete len:264 (+) Transcript_71417:708-1499(+)